MKRNATMVSAICMIVFLLASCGGNVLDNLGKMGENVYGSRADTAKVDKTDEKLSETVTYGEESAAIDWGEASDAVKVGTEEVSGSTQLKQAMHEKMSEKITEDKQESGKVSQAMKDKLDDIGTKIGGSETASPATGSIAEATAAIRKSVAEEPTKADLATVAIVGSLAEDAVRIAEAEKGTEEYYKTMNEVAKNSLSAIKALKVIGSVSKIEPMLSEIDFSAFIPESGKAKAMELDAEEADGLIARISESTRPILENLKALMEEDGVFSADAYARVVSDMYALRIAYEVYAAALNPIEAQDIEAALENALAIVKGEVGYIGQEQAREESGFIFDDIVYYSLSLILTEKDGVVYGNLCDYLEDPESAEDSLKDIVKLRGVTEQEETAAYNTAAILLDASGWSETIRKVSGENLTVTNILQNVDKYRFRTVQAEQAED